MFVVIALVKKKWLCDLPLFDYLKGKKTLAVIVSKSVRSYFTHKLNDHTSEQLAKQSL